MAVRLGSDGTLEESLRVLVIDRDTKFLEQALSCLTAANLEVETVHDGLQGLSLALKSRFDVAIVCMEAPTVCGANIIRTLRTEPATSEMVLFAVANPSPEQDKSVFEAYRAGADVCLTKPIEPDELVRFVTIVAQRR